VVAGHCLPPVVASGVGATQAVAVVAAVVAEAAAVAAASVVVGKLVMGWLEVVGVVVSDCVAPVAEIWA